MGKFRARGEEQADGRNENLSERTGKRGELPPKNKTSLRERLMAHEKLTEQIGVLSSWPYRRYEKLELDFRMEDLYFRRGTEKLSIGGEEHDAKTCRRDETGHSRTDNIKTTLLRQGGKESR